MRLGHFESEKDFLYRYMEQSWFWAHISQYLIDWKNRVKSLDDIFKNN